MPTDAEQSGLIQIVEIESPQEALTLVFMRMSRKDVEKLAKDQGWHVWISKFDSIPEQRTWTLYHNGVHVGSHFYDEPGKYRLLLLSNNCQGGK